MPTAFRVKTKAEIQAQMFATHRAQLGPDTDLNVGSLDRTQLEASALQHADEYVQIGKLVDLFFRGNCKGDDLDRRAEDFGSVVFSTMRRRKAQTSITQIVVGDGSTRKTALMGADTVQGITSFSVTDATGWPASGSLIIERGTLREESITYTRVGVIFTVVVPSTGLRNPHLQVGSVETTATKSVITVAIGVAAGSCQILSGTEGDWPLSGSVIFERDTVRRELRTFTRVGTVLTLGALTTFAHAINSDVTLSTFGSDRPIASGTIGFVPESASSTRVLFRTVGATAFLFDGELVTGLINMESDAAGVQTKVGSNTITQWQSEPFANATITNPNAATRGTDREDDDTYNNRISSFIQSLSRGTALSIETLVAGQQDPFSNRIIAFAETVEPVAPGQSLLYISDGTATFTIDSEIKTGRDVLISDARIGDRRSSLHAYGPFFKVQSPAAQRTPRLFKSETNGSGVATLVGANFLEDSSKVWTVNQWAGFVMKAGDDQFYSIVSNSVIRLTLSAIGATPAFGSYAIFNFANDPLIPDTDYIFNQSNGDLELTVALGIHDSLIAADDNALGSVGAYTYSRGLAAYAQRLVNGDKTDLDNFPGIRSLGTQCKVVIPTVVTPTIVIQVVSVSGVADAALASTVQSVVQAYVNGLGMGKAVLLSEVIRLVKSVPGVADCRVLSPAANFSVLDGQIARMNASDVVIA